MPALRSPRSAADEPHLRVLLVEDDPGDAFLVQELLGTDDRTFSVEWTQTLAAARALETSAIDCALVDLGLPDASGMEALRQIVQLCPQAAVVVLTGLADRSLAIQAVAAGAQDYLIKDEVNPTVLERTIRLAVERRVAERAALALAEATIRQQHNEQVARGLLPKLRVDAHDLSLVTRYLPASAGDVLGGDFLDAVELADGSVRAIIGDVAGHGPDEAAIGVNLRIAWRALTLAGADTDTVMRRLQDMVINDIDEDELFVTATEVTISADRHSLVARHAGHPPPLLVTSSGVADIDGPRGPVLGMALDDVPPGIHADLPSHWQLLIFTDGLIEGRAGDSRWGVGGLLDHVRSLQPMAPEELIDNVVAEAIRRNERPLDDDVAVLLISRHAG